MRGPSCWFTLLEKMLLAHFHNYQYLPCKQCVKMKWGKQRGGGRERTQTWLSSHIHYKILAPFFFGGGGAEKIGERAQACTSMYLKIIQGTSKKLPFFSIFLKTLMTTYKLLCSFMQWSTIFRVEVFSNLPPESLAPIKPLYSLFSFSKLIRYML